MKKYPTKFILVFGMITLVFHAISLANLPIVIPASGISWTITYEEGSQPSAAQVSPISEEHAAALALHQRIAPKLIRSEAYRIGEEFIREDFYANNLKLQTYINPRIFIEEQRSGDEILASSRVLSEVVERDKKFLFFPELAEFDRAEPQGEINEGKFKGMLKFLLRNTELENERKMVANYMREQGYETDIDKEVPPEQYVIMNPKTKLPVAFFNGSETAIYNYSTAQKKPSLSPAVLNLKARLENP